MTFKVTEQKTVTSKENEMASPATAAKEIVEREAMLLADAAQKQKNEEEKAR